MQYILEFQVWNSRSFVHFLLMFKYWPRENVSDRPCWVKTIYFKKLLLVLMYVAYSSELGSNSQSVFNPCSRGWNCPGKATFHFPRKQPWLAVVIIHAKVLYSRSPAEISTPVYVFVRLSVRPSHTRYDSACRPTNSMSPPPSVFSNPKHTTLRVRARCSLWNILSETTTETKINPSVKLIKWCKHQIFTEVWKGLFRCS